MKAFRLLEWGKPGQYCEVPVPSPKPGEVLIRMKAAGLCRSDLDMVDSQPGSDPYATAVDVPYTLGHENAGVIEVLGEGVTDLKVGEGVAVRHMPHCSHCEFCIRGIEQHCETYKRGAIEITRGTGFDGGLAEFMICPRDQLVSIGNEDPIQYAPLMDAGVTAYHAVGTIKDRLRPGSSTLVIGCGGLGVYAIQFLLLLMGVRVYAVDISEHRLNLANELGAKRSFKAGPNAYKEILEETNGKGIDGIIDFVGSNASLDLAMKVSRPQGRVVLVGMDMGTVEVGWNKIATSCEFAISLGSTRRDCEEVCYLAGAGKLKIDIDRFPFDKVPEAYQALRDGKLTGRAVIKFD
ncbi:chaperonin 10-like protein [Exophiala viscosa]|uniref:Chaperonin 10-like protein n=1 Tax=Exophiala viscosa TaxID=2486360 RepID=A0AAN6DYK4_9EURO|nr:chaperonin 10-like protein [Exophiala viscosa]KAI1622548.1 chaperonin 10-like protein [Exophiala viscosa]